MFSAFFKAKLLQFGAGIGLCETVPEKVFTVTAFCICKLRRKMSDRYAKNLSPL